MTVLLSNGRNKLNDAMRIILKTFLREEDYVRGIFIKPNIVFPVKPESGEITRPEIVRSLVFALREHHPDVDIVLGEGVAVGCDPQENFNVSGFDFFETYHKDLYDELNQNLFGKSIHYKEDVIKHYLFNSYLIFKTLESIKNDNDLYNKNISTYNFIKNEFEGIIRIIINNCISFGIDFTLIVQNLKIPKKTIDMDYYERQKLYFGISTSD